MKKLFALLACLFVAAACNTEDEISFKTQIGYRGTLDMHLQADPSQSYTYENVSFELKSSTEDNTLTLWIYDMQFPGMPMAIDMTLPGIGYTSSGDTATLSADEVIPYYGERPMEERKITALRGTATAERLTLTFECMGYSLSYTGTK